MSTSTGVATSDDVEESVIRQRLLLRETNLKRVTKKFLTLSEAVSTAKPEAERNEALQSVLRELNMYEFAMQKAEITCHTYEEEKRYYDELCAQREAQIQQAEREMEALKTLLSEERVNLQHKEEYAALKKAINERPSSQDSEKEIARLEAEVAELQRNAEEVSSKLDSRTKQFGLLLHSISLLASDMGNTPVAPKPVQSPNSADIEMTDAAQ